MFKIYLDDKLCVETGKIENIPEKLMKATASESYSRSGKSKRKIPFTAYTQKGWKEEIIETLKKHKEYIESKYGTGLYEFPYELALENKAGYSVILKITEDNPESRRNCNDVICELSH